MTGWATGCGARRRSRLAPWSRSSPRGCSPGCSSTTPASMASTRWCSTSSTSAPSKRTSDLALALESRGALRADLRLLVMSATLDSAGVAALLGGAPVIESAGRAFPVAVVWAPPDPRQRWEDAVAAVVPQGHCRTARGRRAGVPTGPGGDRQGGRAAGRICPGRGGSAPRIGRPCRAGPFVPRWYDSAGSFWRHRSRRPRSRCRAFGWWSTAGWPGDRTWIPGEVWAGSRPCGCRRLRPSSGGGARGGWHPGSATGCGPRLNMAG